MLALVKRLESEGLWSEIRQLNSAGAANLPPADSARVLLSLSKAYEETATGGDDYRKALHFAKLALMASPAESLIRTWSLQAVAALAADLGQHKHAEQASLAFLEAVQRQPDATVLLSWVRFALGRSKASQRRYTEAVTLFRQALGTAEGALAERIRLHISWTLAEAGRVTEAFAALPDRLAYLPPGYLHAASAVVFAATEDWQNARLHALAALESRAAGEWQVYDTVQAASMYAVLKRSAQATGHHGQALIWHMRSTETLSRWSAGLDLLPDLPTGGGELFEVTPPRAGAAGHARTGLRGVIG